MVTFGEIAGAERRHSAPESLTASGSLSLQMWSDGALRSLATRRPNARGLRVMLSWGSAPPGTGTSQIWAGQWRGV
jgi:hypothetical protein